jgi:hypothetical protein
VREAAAEILRPVLADFAEHCEAAIKIMRIEEPSAYIRLIASLMPKEFTVTDNALGDVSDEDLQQLLARAGNAQDR